MNSLTTGKDLPFAFGPRSKTPLTTAPISWSTSQMGNVASKLGNGKAKTTVPSLSYTLIASLESDIRHERQDQ